MRLRYQKAIVSELNNIASETEQQEISFMAWHMTDFYQKEKSAFWQEFWASWTWINTTESLLLQQRFTQ